MVLGKVTGDVKLPKSVMITKMDYNIYFMVFDIIWDENILHMNNIFIPLLEIYKFNRRRNKLWN